jgi:hypothetical protein
MSFLNDLSDRLAVMEQVVQKLPAELDSVVKRLDWGKLQGILIRLEQDCDRLYEKRVAAQDIKGIVLPGIFDMEALSLRPITAADRGRWRDAYKAKLRVLIGGGKVEVMEASEIAGKCKTRVSREVPVVPQQGYIVLRWDQYIKLLDEIGRLIGD